MSEIGSRWVVVLTGIFDEDDALRLENELLPKCLDGFPKELVFDLRPLDEFSVFARTVLVRIQREIGKAEQTRTAYVADRPRFRGLGLWIAHLADDPYAKSCMNEDQIEVWLASTVKRDEESTVLAGRKT